MTPSAPFFLTARNAFQQNNYLTHARCSSYTSYHLCRQLCQDYAAEGIPPQVQWLSSYYQHYAYQGYITPLIIAFISQKMGYGAFTPQPMQAKQWVGLYTGIIRLRRNPNPYCFTYPIQCWYRRKLTIDGQAYGNWIRYLNHRSKPNCDPFPLWMHGSIHIALRTNRAIEAGEELCYNYGAPYWKPKQAPEEQPPYHIAMLTKQQLDTIPICNQTT